jgi:hypothetical protein
MDPTTHEIALNAVFDALALRGPGENGGYMRTSTPGQHMTPERLRLARAVADKLPAGTTHANADSVALELCPFIRAYLSK